LAEFNIYKPESELIKFEKIIREDFQNNPPATIKEAAARIEKLTGIKRGTTQVRKLILKIGMRFIKVGQIPLMADPDIQQEYKEKILEPILTEAREGTRAVFFLDAAHFVMGAFLGFLWCFKRIFIKTPSGRKRFNVLGALNTITSEVITVTNDAYIKAETVCEFLSKIRIKLPSIPISLVMDNDIKKAI